MKLSSHVRNLLLVALAAPLAPAASIPWSLSPVTLQGCCIPPLNQQTAILSGTFAFDPLTQIYSGWNFNISGYTNPLTPLNGILTPANSSIVIGGPTFLHLLYASQQADLVMTFGFMTIGGVILVPLTEAGGDVPVLISNSARFVSFSASSTGTVSSIPEPAAGVAVLIGAAILCFWKPGKFGRRVAR